MAKGKKTGGRKAGTPNKATAEVREIARQYTTEAVETLVSVMRDKGASDAAKVSAANALLDRGFGKPSIHVEPIKLEKPEASMEEVARMLVFSLRDAEERGVIEGEVV